MGITPHPPAPRFHLQWWWLAVAWLALAAGVAAALWFERAQIEAQESQRLAHQAHAIHDNLERQLDAINHALSSLIGQLPHEPVLGGGELSERLRVLSNAIAGVRTLSLIGPDGQVLAASRDILAHENLSQRSYFLAARASKSPYTLVVSPPFAALPDRWFVTLARIVPGPGGGFGGVVAATLDPDAFRTLLESARYAPDMQASLIHGDGRRFLTAALQMLPAGADLAQPDTLFTRLRATGRASGVLRGVVQPGASPRLLAFATVAPAALRMDKPLVVTVTRDWNAIFAPWRAKALALAGAHIAVGLAAAVGWLVLRRRQGELTGRERALAHMDALLQERWRTVLEATNQGAWDHDIRSGTVYYSPVWRAMLGYAEYEIGNTPQEWRGRVHPDDAQRVQADLQRHLDGAAASYDSTYRLRCKDGGYLWVHDRGRVTERDAQGRPLRLIGAQTDVSERHRLQERLDSLAENVPGVIYQYQLEPDGRSRFPYASAGVLDMYGLTPEALQVDAAPAFASMHPGDLDRVRMSIAQSARTLELWVDEFRVLSPEHGERWLSGVARPLRLASGAVLWHGYLHDVTEAKQQALQLQDAERVLRHLLQEMPLGLCMIDEAGLFYFRNRRFLSYFGYAEDEELTLQRWWLEVYPDAAYRAEVLRTWNAALAHAEAHGGVIPNCEFRVTMRDGAQRIMVIGGLQFGNHRLVTFEDRTEQQAQSELLRKLAYMDGLTGVANRRHFDRALLAEWRRCRRSHKPLALAMVDIDHFKQYNDVYGHQQGDKCLRAVAEALRAGLGRSHDLVSRYGGEEFVCLLPECDLAGAYAKAQALCRAVQAMGLPHAGSQVASVVTLSAGVACLVPNGDSDAPALVALADAHLYRAKEAGRNRVHDGTETEPELL